MTEPSKNVLLCALTDPPRRESAAKKLRFRMGNMRVAIDGTLENTGITKEMLASYWGRDMTREEQEGVLEMAMLLLIVRNGLEGAG